MSKTPKREPLTDVERTVLHLNAQPWARGCSAEMQTLWNELMTGLAEQLVTLGVSEADRDEMLTYAAKLLAKRKAHVLARWTLPHVLALAKPQDPKLNQVEARHG
jgi:hypothetical protein